MTYIKFLVLIPFLTLFYQLYTYAVQLKGEERQQFCRTLGIVSFTIGIASLITRDPLYVIAGIIFMMFGFRLLAHGLDRMDKKIFIDRYNHSFVEQETESPAVQESTGTLPSIPAETL